MALNGNGDGMVMPVAPMMGGYGNGFGFDGFGGGSGWWVILFLFAMMGNGFGGWGNWGGFGNLGAVDGVLPYFYNTQTQNDVNRGFDTQNLQAQIQGVQNSVENNNTNNQLQSILSAINTGFSNAEVAACNRNTTNLQALYQNQIADMNQRFSLATATDDRLDNLAMSLQKCCCDNQLATVQTQNLVNTQAAENRFQAAQNTSSILQNATANTQAVLDKLCQLELDGVKAERDNLRSQLQMANLQASQTAQTAALTADNAAQTQYIVNRVAPYPIPAYQVGNPYGYYYNGFNSGCGCGCNGFANGVA